jgi:hypothetical protein
MHLNLVLPCLFGRWTSVVDALEAISVSLLELSSAKQSWNSVARIAANTHI